LIEEPAEVAGILLKKQGQWAAANWGSADGVRINDGGYSFRNPDNSFALPGERLSDISHALNDVR
jgi:hypothetical protein